MVANVVSENGNVACAALEVKPAGYVRVFANFYAMYASNGDKNGSVYWSNDGGATAATFDELDAGTELIWNACFSWAELTGNEIIEFDYEEAPADPAP